MAIITIPAITATSMTLRLVRGDSVLEFFDGSVVVAQSTKAVWILSFPLVARRLSVATTRLWWSALVQLAKPANQFKVYPPAWEQGAGYTGANPLVVGGSQLGLSLVCDGAANNDLVGLEGDPIEVNTEFKILTADANSNGAGAVTFNFEPALRTSPSNNAVVNVKTPEITMRMITPAAAISATLPEHFNITIDAIEHFGP